MHWELGLRILVSLMGYGGLITYSKPRMEGIQTSGGVWGHLIMHSDPRIEGFSKFWWEYRGLIMHSKRRVEGIRKSGGVWVPNNVF